LREGVSEVEDVEEGKVAEQRDADRTWRKHSVSFDQPV
jgi:hypothetical protein